MQQIGAFEAKNKLGSLLDCVEHGDEVIITRRGKPVARLSSYSTAQQSESEKAAQAAQRIRERATKLGLKKFDWGEWKSYRDEERP